MQEAMQELSIGEVTRRAGINPSAVRYYESIGLLPAPQRIHGRRRYSAESVQMLAAIQFAQDAGFTLAEIKALFNGFEDDTPAGERWRVLARQKITEVDDLIRRAERMKHLLIAGMECGCVRLQDCPLIHI